MKKSYLCLVFLIIFYNCGITKVAIKEKEKAKWEGLSTSVTTLKSKPSIDSNDLNLFISKDVIEQNIKTVKNDDYFYRKNGFFKDWRINVEDVELKPENGLILAFLKLTVYNRKDKKKAQLKFEGQLTTSKIIKNSNDDSDEIEFKLIPLIVRPSVKIFGINFGISKKRSDDLAKLITYLKEENPFKFSVKLPNSLSHSLELVENNKVERINVDKEQKWYYDLKYSSENRNFKKYINVYSPVYLNEGIFISAELNNNSKPSELDSIAAPNVSISDLKKRNVQLENQLIELKNETGINTSESSLFLNRSIFLEYLNLLNPIKKKNKIQIGDAKTYLPDTKIYNEISVNSIKVNGYLSESKSEAHPILGLISLFVKLNGDKAINSKIRIKEFKNNWVKNSGINFNLKTDVDLEVKIKSYLGPSVTYLKGIDGPGFTVGLEGSANPSIKGDLSFQSHNIGGRKTILMLPNIECKTIPVKVQTDGKYAFSTKWTKVPKIGLTIQQLIGEDFIDPSPILSSEKTWKKTKQYKVNKNGYQLVKNHKLEIQNFKPKNVEVKKNGLQIYFGQEIITSNDLELIKELKKKRKNFQNELKSFYRNQEKKCNKSTEIAVHVGNLEFGSNNDIIKFLVNAWSDIINGPGENNDLVKLVNNVGLAITNGTVADELAINSMKEIAGFAEKSLGKYNEASKALRKLSNEVEKVLTKPGNAVGDVTKNIINEGGKALNKIKCGLFGC